MSDGQIIGTLLIKCYRNEELSAEDIGIAERYRQEDIFDVLPKDIQKDALDLIEMVDNIQIQRHGKSQSYVKKLGEWPGYREMIRKGVY